MKKAQILACLCLFVLLSCNSNTENRTSDFAFKTFLIENYPKKNLPLLKLSQLADSVSYIPLETKEECLISFAIPHSGHIYSVGNSGILRFDEKGNFLHQVGGIGGSEEEYPDMQRSFDVDESDGVLYVIVEKSFKCYDEDGRYMKTIRNDKLRRDNFIVRDKVAFFTSTMYSETEWTIIDIQTGNIIKEKKYPFEIRPSANSEDVNYNYINKAYVKSYDGNEYYYHPINDTLYCLQDKELHPVCCIRLDGVHDPVNGQMNREVIYQKARVHISGITKFKKYMIVSMVAEAESEEPIDYNVLLDLRDGSVSYYGSRIINDLDGGPDIILLTYHSEYGSYLNLVVENMKNNEEFYDGYFTPGVKAVLPDQDGKFQRILAPLEDDANPIVRIVHWKNSL